MTDLHRLDVSGTLILLSPLHIGSGEWRAELRPGRRKDGVRQADETIQVAEIQRAGSAQPGRLGKPWIPATSLKGVLLRLAAASYPKADLFGTHEGAARMGALQFRGAVMGKPGKKVGARASDDGIYIATRTAIDRGPLRRDGE